MKIGPAASVTKPFLLPAEHLRVLHLSHFPQGRMLEKIFACILFPDVLYYLKSKDI